VGVFDGGWGVGGDSPDISQTPDLSFAGTPGYDANGNPIGTGADPVAGDPSLGTPDAFVLGDPNAGSGGFGNVGTDTGDQFSLGDFPGSSLKPSALSSGGLIGTLSGGLQGALDGPNSGGGGFRLASGPQTTFNMSGPSLSYSSGGGLVPWSPYTVRGLVKPAIVALAWRAARAFGKDGLAFIIGKFKLDLGKLLESMLTKGRSGGRRRSRGVTGRQLRNAARVARTLSSMQQQFRRAAGLGGGHHGRPRAQPFPFRRRKR
jgi:hypothetical protein